MRDAAAKAFGTLSLVVGERAISGYIAKLDAIKQKKVKDSTPQALPPTALAALAAPPPPEKGESSSSEKPSDGPKVKRMPSRKEEKPSAKEEKTAVKEDKVMEDVKEEKKTIQQAVSRPPPLSEAPPSSSKDEPASKPLVCKPLVFARNNVIYEYYLGSQARCPCCQKSCSF